MLDKSYRDLKLVPDKWESIIAVVGFCLLALAVLLDKYALGWKVAMTLAVEFITLFLLVNQFRRRILIEKRVVLLLFVVGSLGLYLYLHRKFNLLGNPDYIRSMYVILSQIPSFLVLALYSVSDAFTPRLEPNYLSNKKYFDRLASFGLLLAGGLVFLFSPSTIHVSDPSSLPFSLFPLLLWHLFYLLLFCVFGYGLYLLSSTSLRGILAPAFAVIAIIAWGYTYLLPGDYGVLDVVIFSHPGRLIGFDRLYGTSEKLLQLGEILAMGLLAVGLFLLTVKLAKHVLPVLVILLLMTLGQTSANIISSPEAWSAGSGNKSAFLPDNSAVTFRLSRKGNVLLIMMDMFTGGFIPEIFEEHPELRSSYDGFVWYPNTISMGTSTFIGLPGILGGEEFAPENVNANPGIPMLDRLSDAYGVFSKAFNNKGYDSVYVHPVYFNLEAEAQERNITVVQPESFAEYWLNNDEEAENLSLQLSAGKYACLFSVVGFFKASPHFLRPYIYTQGRWLNFNRGDLEIRNAVNSLAFLTMLTELGTVDNGKPTFKYIGNELTHLPWAIDEALRLSMDAGGGRRYFPEYDFLLADKDRPYRSAVRTLMELAEYFNWMRQQGIWDVTKIVIVSDHGYYGPSPMWPKMPVLRSVDGTILEGSAAYHSLLMVKDYESEGELRRDNRLMSTADTANIVLSALGGEENLAADLTKKAADPEREVVTTLTPVPPEEHERDAYTIDYQFVVSGDPADPSNWHQVIPEP